jgi:hypothetical protein
MFETLEKSLLSLLRVPPEPEPPFGAPDSVRVFRASRKLYLLRVVRWGLAQTAALAGIIFWFGVIAVSEHEADRMRARNQGGNALARLPSGRNQFLAPPLQRLPPSLFGWLWAAKGLGFLIYGVQLAGTYLAVRLDYRMRWYIVTDRSLRIRWGLWQVQEATMSYANVQQVVVFQGPLERFLGLGNVRVQSAGGGSGSQGEGENSGGAMHTGVFHGVENAAEIRNLILERLRRFRESGLGDPEEIPRSQAQSVPELADQSAVEAARELLMEARKLRHFLTRGERNVTIPRLPSS